MGSLVLTKQNSSPIRRETQLQNKSVATVFEACNSIEHDYVFSLDPFIVLEGDKDSRDRSSAASIEESTMLNVL